MHLTKIHLLERQKRRHNRLLQFGVMQCKGTKPRGFRQPTESIWRPMPRPILSPLDLLLRLNKMFDWLRPQRAPKKVDKI